MTNNRPNTAEAVAVTLSSGVITVLISITAAIVAGTAFAVRIDERVATLGAQAASNAARLDSIGRWVELNRSRIQYIERGTDKPQR